MAEKMKYCGLGILIVNHFKDNAELIRPDAENEKNRMIELYAALGLEVEKHEDLTLKQMEDVLVEVSKSENLKNYDILVIGISSHGGDSGLFGIDVQKDNPGAGGKALSDGFIHRKFNSEKCPALKDKPKLIIRNGGRGKTIQLSVPKITSDGKPPPVKSGDEEEIGTDFLTICSTVDGYGPFKQIQKGSNLAPFLKDAIEKNPKENLLSLLNGVDEKFSSVGYLDEDEDVTVQESLSVTNGMEEKSLILNNGSMKDVSYKAIPKT